MRLWLALPVYLLAALFGAIGRALYRLARAIDGTPELPPPQIPPLKGQ